jgi:hypothetical protein
MGKPVRPPPVCCQGLILLSLPVAEGAERMYLRGAQENKRGMLSNARKETRDATSKIGSLV